MDERNSHVGNRRADPDHYSDLYIVLTTANGQPQLATANWQPP